MARNSAVSSPDGKGMKRTYSELDRVHSANEWENADLGDNSRKQKFLRLMGASKSEHPARLHIGESSTAESAHHTRTSEENEAVSKNLEDQFSHGVEHPEHGHLGLGFHQAFVPAASGESEQLDRVTGGVKMPTCKTSPEPDIVNSCSTTVDSSSHTEPPKHWQQVDLGNHDRKNKFLRLMGASKSKSKIEAAEPCSSSPSSSTALESVPAVQADVESLERKLEEQYRQGLELKLSGAVRQHKGLGYVPPPAPEPLPRDNTEEPHSTTENTDSHSKSSRRNERSQPDKKSERTHFSADSCS